MYACTSSSARIVRTRYDQYHNCSLHGPDSDGWEYAGGARVGVGAGDASSCPLLRERFTSPARSWTPLLDLRLCSLSRFPLGALKVRV